MQVLTSRAVPPPPTHTQTGARPARLGSLLVPQQVRTIPRLRPDQGGLAGPRRVIGHAVPCCLVQPGVPQLGQGHQRVHSHQPDGGDVLHPVGWNCHCARPRPPPSPAHACSHTPNFCVCRRPDLLRLARWYSDEIAHRSFQEFDVCPQDDSCASFLWTAVIPFAFTVCHALVYLILIKARTHALGAGVVVAGRQSRAYLLRADRPSVVLRCAQCWQAVCPLPSDKSYLTTYRYLSRKGGPAAIFRRCVGFCSSRLRQHPPLACPFVLRAV